MGIDVRQLIVKSHVLEDGGDSDLVPEQDSSLKRVILEECRRMIEDALDELKER